MRVLQTLALPLGYVTKQEKEQAVAPFSFAEWVTVSADGARKMKWSGRRGFRRSAACGGYSEAESRKRRENCPQGRARRPLPRRCAPTEQAKKAPPFGGAFGAGDEDFAEAPPAADTARRNRGSGGRIARKGGQGDHCRDGERRWSAQKSTIFRWCLWSGRRGSNSLPPPWQGGALPDELRPRNDAYYSRPFLICQVKKRFLANKSPKCTQPFSVRAV